MLRPKLSRESKHEFENEFPMALRRAVLAIADVDEDEEAVRAMRALMEIVGMPNVCERGRCRRHGRCLTRKVDCAFLHAPWLEEYVFSELDDVEEADGPPW